MKNNKAAGLLKSIIAALREMAKAKTLALRTKTNALRRRLIIFSLLRNKKLLVTSLSQKLRSLVNSGRQHHHKEIEQEEEEHQIIITPAGDHHDDHALVLYYQNTSCNCTDTSSTAANLNMVESSLYIGEDLEEGVYGTDDDENDDEEEYPDLTHSLFESDEGGGGSVIDMVKNGKEEKGEEFCLEEEIDHVADLFIRRFHHQIRIERQLSLNRRRHHHQQHMLLPEPTHA